jgi:hypothetical protein
MRRSRVVAVAVAAAYACGAATASAEPLALSTVAANVPIAAHGGWVAWSAPATGGGWGLAAWHDGQVIALPVARRAQPFDVDLGTDARGRTVATFSRCTTAPTDYFGRLQTWTGAGCRVRVVDLATGRERAAGVRRPAGASDTTPSMWRGRIAFARRDRRHKDVAQVLLWSPATHRVTALRHGAVPTDCPYQGGCEGMTVRGSVQGLDLGSRLATFLWWVEAPGVVGHGGWEVRADRLDEGRSVLTGAGFVGEACTGSVDGVAPSVPAADGDDVWYSRLTSACYVDTTSVVRFDARTRRAAVGELSGEILRFAKDGDALYALVAPTPQDKVAPACDAPGAPCTIERIDAPALVSKSYTPHSPFF